MGEHGGAESQILPVRRSAPGRDEALPVNPIAPWGAPRYPVAPARAAGAPVGLWLTACRCAWLAMR
ncbi:hypothetical protein CAI18_04210 [Xanthomonas citri pv. punicae]|nr:hypothetical protein xavtCFBP7764_09540 [Xanthomonas citri]QCZ65991.1 hypothetical protein CAI14_16955 [Xanthomonas citri pv. punicae]QCZ69699.1 hypothetical protein CAI17_14590 [Xanthomonas citri pv. punicae]QCZ73766.1 hypothetical protein CAB38_14700 [Xanthomonas citri pv. punicae]QCZ75815.1 hypothetical protein XapA_02185 [Xanthomonas citri pv. punicae]